MRILAFLLVVFHSQFGYAQTPATIIRTVGYFTIPIPGALMVDESGNPVPRKREKVYTVIVEYKGAAPVWSGGWIAGRYFSVQAAPVQGNTASPGNRMIDANPIEVKAAKGHFLQQLTFTRNSLYRKAPRKTGPGILLEGQAGRGRIYYTVSRLTELASPAYP